MQLTLLWLLRITITTLMVVTIGNNEGWWVAWIDNATWGRMLFGTLALLPWVIK